MVRIVGLKYVLALAAPVVIAAGTVVYAAQEQRFDLPINATVTLVQQSGTEAADLNVDGRVDARDLLIITRNFNPRPPGDPRADVDKSGAVDLRDLAFVALYLNP